MKQFEDPPQPSADNPSSLRSWLFQDWSSNSKRHDSQILLLWFRLAQWAHTRWGLPGRIVVSTYWWFTSLIVGIELPPTAIVGPRLHLYHPHTIVIHPHSRLGSDCSLRHSVTIGNRVDRFGIEHGVATLGNYVDLGAGCAVIGDLHVGDHARIGALSVVTKSVPAWAVVAGNPSRVIRIDPPESSGSEHDDPEESRST